MIDKFYWQYKKKLFKNHTNQLEVYKTWDYIQMSLNFQYFLYS